MNPSVQVITETDAYIINHQLYFQNMNYRLSSGDPLSHVPDCTSLDYELKVANENYILAYWRGTDIYTLIDKKNLGQSVVIGG